MPIAPNHPIEELFFSVVDEITDDMAAVIAEAVERLAKSRGWLLHPPEFLYQEDDTDCILGGTLELYSVMPPLEIPLEAEQQQWEETNAFVRAFQDLSSKYHWEFDCFYRNESIGFIEDGIMNVSLTEGLLGEWKRVIDEKAAKMRG